MPSITARITEYDDIIDSRELITHIEYLRSDKEGDPESFHLDEELSALEKFAAEAEQYCEDWHHGAALVRYSHFTDYVKELLIDCGDIPRTLPHYVRIDWEATARELEIDYTPVKFGDSIYWVR